MKCNRIATALTLLAAMTLLTLPSCTNKKDKPEATKTAADDSTAKPAPALPAIVATSESSASANITAIDPATRTVTLKNAAGETHKYQCGPAVQNFGQLRVGDTVNATIVEQLRIFVQKGAGAPPGMAVGSTMARAPKGSTPGAIVSETLQRNATITALDPNQHLVTVKNAEGETRTYAVDPGIDLSGVHVGDDVITQYSYGLAIVVESNRTP